MTAPAGGARLVGVLTLASTIAVVLSGIGEARDASWTGIARVVGLLLLLPAVALLASWAGPRRPLVVVATVCGAAAILLWATAGFFVPWSWEWVWIALSAAWWLLLARPLRALRPRLGVFTLIVGIAAALDAFATLAESKLPPLAFGVLGGWKIPLALVWQVWVGVAALREPPRPRPPEDRVSIYSPPAR